MKKQSQQIEKRKKRKGHEYSHGMIAIPVLFSSVCLIEENKEIFLSQRSDFTKLAITHCPGFCLKPGKFESKLPTETGTQLCIRCDSLGGRVFLWQTDCLMENEWRSEALEFEILL